MIKCLRVKRLKIKKYIHSVNAKGIFDNTYEAKLPQTVIGGIILKHFENRQKTPKCLFIGWDGCRADAMKYIIKSENEQVSGKNDTNIYSAIASLKDNGGLYITYVGGAISSCGFGAAAEKFGWNFVIVIWIVAAFLTVVFSFLSNRKWKRFIK